MAKRTPRLHGAKRGSALAVRVTPRSGRNRIAGVMSDGTVKIQLTAAPVDGEANGKLVEFLGEVLGVPKSSIEIVAGHSSRSKLVSITGLDPETTQQRLLTHIN